MAVKGKKERYWPMRSGGPYDDKPGQNVSHEIFKCTGCGSETAPEEGWNGAPDKHRCSPACACHTDLSIAQGDNSSYRKNFDRIFPDAPGAGL
jgi:hypothetical protein